MDQRASLLKEAVALKDEGQRVRQLGAGLSAKDCVRLVTFALELEQRARDLERQADASEIGGSSSATNGMPRH
jgi:hypothetical protein